MSRRWVRCVVFASNKLSNTERAPVSNKRASPEPWEYTPGRARVQVGGVRAARTGIWGKGTGAAQFPIESVSEELAREQ